MQPLTLLAVASTMFLYVVVALCAMWAWQNRDWWLSVPLTLIFLAATAAMVWTLERWGT
jgi:isoprenylcysteine carboxyl methyltransferase (ICMT) family protein YpbQ